MASQSTIKYHIEKAAETNRILDERLEVGGHQPGTTSWYAYLSGRMSAQLESMAEILANDLLNEDEDD